MARSPFLHVKLAGVPVKAEGVRLKSADVVRVSPDLAIINMEVHGKHEGLRFDLAKQIFLDSLGTKKLDRVVDNLKEPITRKIQTAQRRSRSASLRGAKKFGRSVRYGSISK